MAIHEHLLDEFSAENRETVRRRSLLPMWIKIFIWLFMILGLVSVPLFIFGLIGSGFYIELYGLKSSVPTSFVALFLEIIFLFKCVVSFCLWFEEKQAIRLGIVDAAFGILVCLLCMFDFPSNVGIQAQRSFRLEIIFLIAYLIKLIRVRARWESAESE
jgi:hypothetical protein